MSLITRCPACGTQFRVVADQLKISDGWVRCGKCREVFDAQAQRSAVEQGLLAPSQPAELSKSEPEIALEQIPEPIRTDSAESVTPKAPASVWPIDKRKQDFSSSDWIDSVNPPAPPEVSDMGAGNVSTLSPQDFTEEELVGSDLAPLFSQSTLDPVAVVTPGFVRQAQRAQRWRSPWVRAGLLVLVLLLTAVLGLQMALQERDRLAAAQPRALPWLQELCAVAGCSVGPLKHIESVLVDASSFNKLRSDGTYDLYKIALSLKNNGTLAVAVPHIELSLNDLQDQPVLRRILKPADLGLLQPTLGPATELAGGATIQIDNAQLAGTRIAGYRVLAFYP